MFLLFSGLIVGWFSLVSDVVAILGCLFSIILLSIYSCEDLKKLVENNGEAMVDSKQFDEVCSIGKGGKNVAFVMKLLGCDLQSCDYFSLQSSLWFW